MPKVKKLPKQQQKARRSSPVAVVRPPQGTVAVAKQVKAVVAVPLPSKELVVLQKETKDVGGLALKLAVTTPEQEKMASDLLSRAAALKKRIEAVWDPLLKSANSLATQIRAQKNEDLEPIVRAIDVIKAKNQEYYNELDRIAAEEAAKETAERQARELKERKARALKLIDEGKYDEANALMAKPSKVAEVVPERAQASGGAQRRVTLDIEIEDESKVPRSYFVIDMVALRQAVLKEKKKVPGVKIIEVKSVAAIAATVTVEDNDGEYN